MIIWYNWHEIQLPVMLSGFRMLLQYYVHFDFGVKLLFYLDIYIRNIVDFGWSVVIADFFLYIRI